jgi:hypothetical protein
LRIREEAQTDDFVDDSLVGVEVIRQAGIAIYIVRIDVKYVYSRQTCSLFLNQNARSALDGLGADSTLAVGAISRQLVTDVSERYFWILTDHILSWLGKESRVRDLDEGGQTIPNLNPTTRLLRARRLTLVSLV